MIPANFVIPSIDGSGREVPPVHVGHSRQAVKLQEMPWVLFEAVTVVIVVFGCTVGFMVK